MAGSAISKPAGGKLWHFDTSLESTDGIKPLEGSVATLRPNEGRFGGAVAVEEGTTNLAAGHDILIYNNDHNQWEMTLTTLSETFMGKPIVRITLKPLTDAARDHVRSSYTAHGCRHSPGITFNANTTYTATIYWRCLKPSVQVQGSPSNIPGWRDYRTEEVGSGWKRSYAKWYDTTTRTDAGGKYWGIRDPLINTGETIVIDFVAPQIEAKPFATSFVDGTRAAGRLRYPQLLNKKRGTLSVWINPHVVTDWNNFFSMNLSTGRFLLFFSANGSSRWDFGPTNSGPGTPAGTIVAGQWTMHTLTWDADAGVYRYYVNGEFVGERQYVEPDSLPSALPTVINYGALLDELLILPYAATEDEIQQWYQTTAPFYDPAELLHARGKAAYQARILDKDRQLRAVLPGVRWHYTRRINEATSIEIHIPREVVDEHITQSHALYGFFMPTQPFVVQGKPTRAKPNKAQYAEIASFIQIYKGDKLKASGKIVGRTLGQVVTVEAYTEEILLETNLTPAQYGKVWDGWDLADVARDLLDGWQSIRVKDQSQWQSYMVDSSNIDLTTNPGHVMLAKDSSGRYRGSGYIALKFEASEVQDYKRWDRIRWSADSEDPVKTTIQYSYDGINWSAEFDGGLPEEIGIGGLGASATLYVRLNLYTNDTESEDPDGNPVGVTPVVFAVEVIARTEGQLLAGNIPDVAGVTVKGIGANHSSALKVLLDACEQNGWEFQVVNGALSIAENLGTDRTKDFVLRAGTNMEITRLGDDDGELVNILTAYGPGSGINRMEITLRDEDSIAQYGKYPAAVEFDVNTLAELQAKAREYLDTHNTPAVAFEVTAVFDTEHEPEYAVGDRVRVVDPETGIITTTRIMAEHREYGENGLIVQLQLGKAGLNLQSVLERIGGPPKPPDPDPPTGVYAKGVIAGIVVGCAAPRGDWAYTECHMSRSKDFIPSPSTLVTKGRQTRFEITGLEMGERYYARLVHVDSRGRRSGPSGEVSAVAAFVPVDDWTQEPPPPVPSGLSLSTGLEYVGQITWSRIIASWEATPETAYYLVRYRRVGESADQWQESATTGTTQKLTPVAGNVQYEVQVRAVGPVGNASPWSAAKTITTARDTSAPAAPVFIEYGGIVKGIYVVLQTPSEEDWDGFEIHVSDSGAGFTPSPSTLKAKGRQTRFEITGLVPGRTYYVKAIAYDTSGNKSAPAY